MDLTIHIDGGSRGNPGPAAAGVVVTDTDAGKTLHAAGYCLGDTTNNVAEYKGLILGLEVARLLSADTVRVFSDSELMVKQLLGEYRVKSPALAPLLEDAQRLLLTVNSWQLRHVRREKNKQADALVNAALDAGRHVVETAAPGADAIAPPVTGRASAPASKSGTRNPKPGTRSGPCWTVRFRKRPGPACPARPRSASQQYTLGPDTPAGLCVYAAQALFDENITLWPDAGLEQGQAECPRCGVEVLAEADD